MKLYYYIFANKVSNFGDSLNPWLWEKFIPQELDDDERIAFIGIGTLLNDYLPRRVPQARRYVVFSSGVGYETQPIPQPDANWTFYCVRGPLSAEKMGISRDYAIADGALLLNRVFKSSAAKQYRFSFMPHVEHAMGGNGLLLSAACDRAGINYIDPRGSIEQILSSIASTETLLAEAMHGAIAAEALRVPWIPVSSSPRILSFKWLDWCSSIKLNYRPAEISPLVSCYPFQPELEQFNEDWLTELQYTDSPNRELIRKGQVQLLSEQLLTITRTFPPNQTQDNHLENLIIRLEERLEQFKKDVKGEKFKE
ncbi:MAG: hypothetical protein N5P05_003794 [Chroococcopsis gigantea SAG 12.99]|jgi:succinoglycan biosynthesis protein ExoV|nr:polysaccharide pyruvyl transferase family protein [Chlorogloea purpurea SAG 13.99]MDV3002188.1 hypothetical protein [Chroococcopsis gigantea SAG 12.99]